MDVPIYRRLPIAACALNPPAIIVPYSPLFTVPSHKFKRVWLETFKRLQIKELLILSQTCRLFYSLTYEPELWHEILLTQVPSFLLSTIQSGQYQTVSPALNVPYGELLETIRDNLPQNSDYITEELEQTLMLQLLSAFPAAESQNLTEAELTTIVPSEYRRIALIYESLKCLSCKTYKVDVVKCPVLGRYLCISCRSLPKYRMMSLHGICKKYGVSKEVLDELNVPHVNTPNPRSINFSDMLLYYGSLTKKELRKNQVPQYLRYAELKAELVKRGYAAGLNMLYGKLFSKYVKDQGLDLEGMIKSVVSRLSRTKTKPKERNPPRVR